MTDGAAVSSDGSRMPYRTRIEDEGLVGMKVPYLIHERTAGSEDLVVGRTVLPLGARHDRHLHPHGDEWRCQVRARPTKKPVASPPLPVT